MTEIVSTRVSDDLAKDLEAIEKEEKTDRATVVRKLLAKAIAEWKLEKALTL
jgi:FixJ family two-component response regulator